MASARLPSLLPLLLLLVVDVLSVYARADAVGWRPTNHLPPASTRRRHPHAASSAAPLSSPPPPPPRGSGRSFGAASARGAGRVGCSASRHVASSPPTATWRRALFQCRDDPNSNIHRPGHAPNRADAPPGCALPLMTDDGGTDRGGPWWDLREGHVGGRRMRTRMKGGAVRELEAFRYLPPRAVVVERSERAAGWARLYDAYERWLFEGGAEDDAAGTTIVYADGATPAKSILWMAHFISAWAVSRGVMVDERRTEESFSTWRWGKGWRLPCPSATSAATREASPPVTEGLLCVFDLGALLSRRGHAAAESTGACDDGKRGGGNKTSGGGGGSGKGFAEEALELFRSEATAGAGTVNQEVPSFDPYTPPPASPSAMFTISAFLRALWERGGLSPALRREVETSSTAALGECLRGVGGVYANDEEGWPRSVSVHVRRGDACMRWAEPGDVDMTFGRPCYRTEHYVRAARNLAETYGASVVLLATDDPDVLEEARRISAEETSADASDTSGKHPSPLHWCMVPDAARGRVGGKQWVNAYDSQAPVDWETYPDSDDAVMIERRLARGELDPAEAVLSLMKDADFLRRGMAFVGTFKSVTGRLMYLSMQGRMRRPPPYVALDMESMEYIV